MLARVTACLSLLVASVSPALGQVTIAPDKESGVYELKEQVTWNIKLADKQTAADNELEYEVKAGGLTKITGGKVGVTNNRAQVSATRDTPGTLLLTVKCKPSDGGKEVTASGGAVFAPDQINASLPPPDDFDAFWKAKIAELDAVPMNVKLERIDIGDAKIAYYKVTLDNIRGTKIHGQLARPAGDAKLPALLQVQWAGVYPLQRDWVVGQARNGWLAMNISAHDLPIDEQESFYAEKAGKELNDYPGQGNDDRETSYFLRMFLSCRRAVDYLTQHPDWNHGALVVHGGSQGGYQAIVTAGLHPAVTALAANVPAGCDHTGKQAGRLPGWPNWAGRTWQGKDEQKMLTAARYFDAMNFASRAKCPALVGLGLIDAACPPDGVLATCNKLAGEKQIIIMPQADHGGDHQAYHKVFGSFLDQQKKLPAKTP